MLRRNIEKEVPFVLGSKGKINFLEVNLTKNIKEIYSKKKLKNTREISVYQLGRTCLLSSWENNIVKFTILSKNVIIYSPKLTDRNT